MADIEHMYTYIYIPLRAEVPRGGEGVGWGGAGWGGAGCNNVHVTCVKGWGGAGCNNVHVTCVKGWGGVGWGVKTFM